MFSKNLIVTATLGLTMAIMVLVELRRRLFDPAASSGEVDIQGVAIRKGASTNRELQTLPDFNVLHLGDSVAAGNAAGSYTSTPSCYRSTNNYGTKYTNWLKQQPGIQGQYNVKYWNRACSGATTGQYWHYQGGLGTKFCTSGAYTPDAHGAYWQYTSWLRCERRVREQKWHFQNQYNPPQFDLVLVQMGANNIGFADIIKYCYISQLIHECRVSLAAAFNGLEPLKTNLRDVLIDVGQRIKSGGKVVISNYPRAQTTDNFVLTQVTDPSNILDVRQNVFDLADAGKAAIADAVDGANEALVGTTDCTTVPDICPIIFNDSIVEDFLTHEPDPNYWQDNPNGWIYEFSTFVDSNEWYHPNGQGHTEWANSLADLGDAPYKVLAPPV